MCRFYHISFWIGVFQKKYPVGSRKNQVKTHLLLRRTVVPVILWYCKTRKVSSSVIGWFVHLSPSSGGHKCMNISNSTSKYQNSFCSPSTYLSVSSQPCWHFLPLTHFDKISIFLQPIIPELERGLLMSKTCWYSFVSN